MKLYILLLVLLFLPQDTYSQFSTCDIRGTTPTLPCNYCTLSPTITIGANSTLPPTPQTLSVGIYSTNLNLGTFSPSTTVATGPTAGPIKIGVEDGSPSTQVLAIGTSTSGGIYVATRPLAGLVNIGVDALPPSPSSQVITIGDYSATLRLGRFANSIIMGTSPTAPSIIIGATTPTPTPTTIQNVNICPWCSTLSMGSGNTGGVSIATGPTAGPVTIGSPTSNPGQTVTVASVSSSLLLGQSVSANIQMGNRNIANTVVVGNDQPSAQPTLLQTVTLARYSNSVGLAESANALTISTYPTAGPVTIGVVSPTPSPTQDIVIGANSRYLLAGTGSPTYKLNYIQVGQLAPVSTTPTIPLQYCQICKYSDSAEFGTDAPKTYIANGPTAGDIELGRSAPSPSPQALVLGRYTPTTYIGEYGTGGVYIADKPTAGPVTIGTSSPTVYIGIGTPTTKVTNVVICQNSPSSSPVNQFCDIGQATTFIRMGDSLIGSLSIATGTGSNNAAIYIGMAVPTGSPSGPPSQNQEVYLFEYSRNVRIAQKIPGQLQLGTDANSGVLIANGPTAGPITLGRTIPAGAPSLAGSNRVQLNGLYHYFYNSMCFGLNTGSPATLNCNYANVRSNAGGGGSGTTSGYNTDENRWYPPEPGHYMITVMGLIRPGVFGALYIFTSIDTVVQAQAYARTTNSADFQTITAVTIQTFNTVGSGDYIEIQGQGMWDDAGASGYNVLSITRVA